MTDHVRPTPAPGSALLRVPGSSHLAFGATTAALVALASGGTAVLVNYGTSGILRATPLATASALPAPARDSGPVVVDRAAGSFEAKPPFDKTAQVLPNALAPPRGRRVRIVPPVMSPLVVARPVVNPPHKVVTHRVPHKVVPHRVPHKVVPHRVPHKVVLHREHRVHRQVGGRHTRVPRRVAAPLEVG